MREIPKRIQEQTRRDNILVDSTKNPFVGCRRRDLQLALTFTTSNRLPMPNHHVGARCRRTRAHRPRLKDAGQAKITGMTIV